jgi:hypothetical protein
MSSDLERLASQVGLDLLHEEVEEQAPTTEHSYAGQAWGHGEVAQDGGQPGPVCINGVNLGPLGVFDLSFGVGLDIEEVEIPAALQGDIVAEIPSVQGDIIADIPAVHRDVIAVVGDVVAVAEIEEVDIDDDGDDDIQFEEPDMPEVSLDLPAEEEHIKPGRKRIAEILILDGEWNFFSSGCLRINGYPPPPSAMGTTTESYNA